MCLQFLQQQQKKGRKDLCLSLVRKITLQQCLQFPLLSLASVNMQVPLFPVCLLERTHSLLFPGSSLPFSMWVKALQIARWLPGWGTGVHQTTRAIWSQTDRQTDSHCLAQVKSASHHQTDRHSYLPLWIICNGETAIGMQWTFSPQVLIWNSIPQASWMLPIRFHTNTIVHKYHST